VVIALSYRYGKKRTTPESSTEFARQLIRENQVKRKRAVVDTVSTLKVTVKDLRDTIEGLQDAVSTAEYEISAVEGLIDDLEQLL
jgi:hypothetical protein